MPPRLRRVRLLLLAGFLCSAAWAGFRSQPQQPLSSGTAFPERADSAGRKGFLLTFSVEDGRTLFQSAAEIDNYMPARHQTADDDWLVMLFHSAGDRIGTDRIGNPGRQSPILSATQALPLTVKVPDLAGLAAIGLYDHNREEQVRVQIDDSFRASAAAHRRAFLAHESNNRRLLLRVRQWRRLAADRKLQETPRFEDMPGELQAVIRGEIIQEIESLEEFGPAIRQAGRFKLEQQQENWIVTGTITGDGGEPIYRANVLLRQLAPTTTAARYWSGTTDTQGTFRYTVPGNLNPNTFVFAAYAPNYTLQSFGLEITGDTVCNVRLTRGLTISGTARDNSESALSGVRVRAYKGGNLVNSALTTTDGSYSFNVPEGVYDLEALPPSGRAVAPASLNNLVVNQSTTWDFPMPDAAGALTIHMNFPNLQAYNRFSIAYLARFEFYRSGLAVYAGAGTRKAGTVDGAKGIFRRTHAVYLNPGTYKLTVFLAGCRPITVPEVEVAASGEISSEISVDIPEPFLWTGVLRGSDGTPLAGMTVQSYNDVALYAETTTTDAAGQFSILLTPNGFVKFYTNPGSNNILRTERLDSVTESRNEDVVLDAFPPFEDSGSPLTQIYGVADRAARWNIVMIGDGYTGVAETYTDANNNGRWDGVLYYDLNSNGVWDRGEPNQRYGNAAAPVDGTNPEAGNEPFNDFNGDGVPNLHDQELFDQNTLDTARSLFGQDEWQLHRGAFNIFRIRLVSNQAGHKVMDEDHNVVVNRDTALGTYLDTPERSYLFKANYTLVSQYINQYVPECDTRIVMVNQPIRMGRVNSYMFQFGGEVPSLSNDYVVAHEMGHNVGLLADEYTEYQSTYAGPESASRNVTSLTDVRHIPWKEFISPGKEIPSVPGSSGVGLFEGASYYTGGRYRPTQHCMMVSGNRYCPVCTSEIEIRLRDITAVVPDPVPISPGSTVPSVYPEFRWQPLGGVSHYLLEIEKSDGSQVLGSYDVYGNTFVLPFALSDSAEYRWRIRGATPNRWGAWSSWITFRPQNPPPVFSGVFAQIAAGGEYQSILTGINTGAAAADALLSFFRSNGSLFDSFAGAPTGTLHIIPNPLGTTRLRFSIPGEVAGGYVRISGNARIDGSVLYQRVQDNLVFSEAGVGLSKPTRNFLVYIDNTGNATSGYAVANLSGAPVTLTLKLRDKNGNETDGTTIPLKAGEHISEFAAQRFPSRAVAGFEGSITFTSNGDVAAVALRYDNLHLSSPSWVFTTIPVLVDEHAATMYFPQLAEGGGYRTSFVLMNPADTATTARFEFYSSDGSPQSLPIGGRADSKFNVPLAGRGVAHLLTDGASQDVSVGWVKVTSPVPITGSAIFQTFSQNQILSEAGVAASPVHTRFISYVESLGSAESGIAICNPGESPVVLTLNLRNSKGEIAAGTSMPLPPRGHVAQFFTQWFLRGFGEFEGSLEVLSSAPVGAVALRYDNPQLNVFATLPVIILP